MDQREFEETLRRRRLALRDVVAAERRNKLQGITSGTVGYMTREIILTWIKDHEPVTPRELIRFWEDNLKHVAEAAFRVEIIWMAEEGLIIIQPNRKIKISLKTRNKFKDKTLEERRQTQLNRELTEWENTNASK